MNEMGKTIHKFNKLIELLKKTQGEMMLGIKNSAIWIKSSVEWEKFQALY